jgi:hypothetical protein
MNVKTPLHLFFSFALEIRFIQKLMCLSSGKGICALICSTHVMCAACRKRLRAIWHAVKPAGCFTLLMGENLTNGQWL